VGFAAAASAAELRPAITVSGETVTLGDIFDDAGNAASVVVAPAPAPGTRAEISISRISLSARRNGIGWRNEAGLTHIVVGRSGTTVPDADVAAAISSAIAAQSSALPSSSVLQIDFASGMAGIQVADGDEPTVKVEQIAFNRRSGAFTAILRAPANDMLSPLRRATCNPARSFASRISTGCVFPRTASARTSSHRSNISSACRRAARPGQASPCALPTCSLRSWSARGRRST
jgi:flagella basal body P-ring formation protein FlgA